MLKQSILLSLAILATPALADDGLCSMWKSAAQASGTYVGEGTIVSGSGGMVTLSVGGKTVTGSAPADMCAGDAVRVIKDSRGMYSADTCVQHPIRTPGRCG